MNIASLIEQFRQPFLAQYGHRLLPSHLRALDAITACKKHCGYFVCECHHCHHRQQHALSCGHRSCPQCQNRSATQWLDRQRQKLIPTEYFMVTLTLPKQLRNLAFHHQHRVYSLLFEAGIETLTTLGLDPRHMGGELGMTAVLHTHTRRLDYHPHLHVVIPAAALINKGKAFKRSTRTYFIHGDVIANMFRGKLLYALHEECFDLPSNIPQQWVVNVEHVGKGLPALQYLSRYLYRGVISENNIVYADAKQVTFRYKDSETNTIQTRTLSGEDFIWKILTHVLPRRFRRVRDYGFLHHNAHKKLTFIQYLLHVKLAISKPLIKTIIRCGQCLNESEIIFVVPKPIPINFRFLRKRICLNNQ